MGSRARRAIGWAAAAALVFGLGAAWWAASAVRTTRAGDAIEPVDAESSEWLATQHVLAMPEPDSTTPLERAADESLSAASRAPAEDEERQRATSARRFDVDVRVVVRSETDGAPVAGVVVALVEERVATLVDRATDERGMTRLRAKVAEGGGELLVRAPQSTSSWFFPFHDFPIALERANGAEIEILARPWPPPAAGEVRGTLRSESGRFEDLVSVLHGGVMLDLVSLPEPDAGSGSGRSVPAAPPRVVVAKPNLAERELPGGERVVDFVFADVPAGDYELGLSSVVPFEWAPPRRRVAPPASGLEFLRRDSAPTSRLRFRVLDAATNEPIERWTAWHVRATTSEWSGVYLHAAPIPFERFPPLEHWNWSLAADGYAPAYGDQSDFDERDDDGTLVATVHLRRGWATRVLVLGRDPRMRPLAGVTLRLDGEPAGTTDASGFAVLRAPETPAALTADLAGFETELAELLPVDHPAAARRGHVTRLFLKRKP